MPTRLRAPENGRPGGPWHAARRAVLLLALAVVGAWRLADSAVASVTSFAQVGLQRRLELATMDEAERARRVLGTAGELLEPLRARVPVDGAVVFSRRDTDLSEPEQARLALLRHVFSVLLYPTEVFSFGGPLPDVSTLRGYRRPGYRGRDLWIVDLTPHLPLPQPDRFEAVLQLENVQLWRWRNGAR